MQIKKAYKKAFKHLESDPVMKYLISKLGREIDIEDRYNCLLYTSPSPRDQA